MDGGGGCDGGGNCERIKTAWGVGVMSAVLMVLKALLMTALKKAGAALIEIIAERILTKELFYDVALKVIRCGLIRWKDSTKNKLDDEIVNEVLTRLDGGGDG